MYLQWKQTCILCVANPQSHYSSLVVNHSSTEHSSMFHFIATSLFWFSLGALICVICCRTRMQRYIQSRTFGNWGDKYLPQALLETKTKLEGFFFNFMGGFKHIYKETLVDVRLSGYHLVMAEGETCTSLTWLNGDAQQSGSEQFGALR